MSVSLLHRTSAGRMERSEVVDTTGAGDAFIGAFLSAFVHGWKLEVPLIASYLCKFDSLVVGQTAALLKNLSMCAVCSLFLRSFHIIAVFLMFPIYSSRTVHGWQPWSQERKSNNTARGRACLHCSKFEICLRSFYCVRRPVHSCDTDFTRMFKIVAYLIYFGQSKLQIQQIVRL